MMISRPPARVPQATNPYVWVWLPGETAPVVAGQIVDQGESMDFYYGRSYLALDNAIPLYEPELPLRSGLIPPEPPLRYANALRDAAPDAWGRRVIINRLTGAFGQAADDAMQDLGELAFLLHSGSEEVCHEAALGDVDRRLLWRRQFLNRLAFEGIESAIGSAINGLGEG